MSKYTTQFKLSAITTFLEQGRGFRRIAAQFQDVCSSESKSRAKAQQKHSRSRSAFLWELACLRCRHLGVSGITS